MCNSSGSIVARYSYDPYGRTTLVSGSNLATFQYTGDYTHQTSGPNMTLFRAYDPNTGRWLSRDPLKNAERAQGPNLYEYVSDDPINGIDPDGLQIAPPVAPPLIAWDGVVLVGFAIGYLKTLARRLPARL